jgi:hypothetical protein
MYNFCDWLCIWGTVYTRYTDWTYTVYTNCYIVLLYQLTVLVLENFLANLKTSCVKYN